MAAQPVFPGALKANRNKVYRNLVQHTISLPLSKPLTDSMEEDWESAFDALILLHYSTPLIDHRISQAVQRADERSISFNRSLVELLYSNYPESFYTEVKQILQNTLDTKLFAMCASYMMQNSKGVADQNFLAVKTKQLMNAYPDDPFLDQLYYQLSIAGKAVKFPNPELIFSPSFLPGNVLMVSFQRSNRNYPGLALVRSAAGNWVKDSLGNIVAVPQLARSNSNMPGYISNGNTPEGIFRMKGFDQSKSGFIGPTINVQMTLPFEKNPADYFRDTTLDSTWNKNQYARLLPAPLRNYYPLYQAWYAGKAGRSEIIAHGTTVDPSWYAHKSYYPWTPTQGCLCTKELWDERTGRRIFSDQQKLTNALIRVGGPDGYVLVINLDDADRPVELADILPYMNKASQKP